MRDVVLKSQVEVSNASHHFDGGDVKHDLLLLQMLEEVSICWPGIDTRKFFLAGFSGGGQFAHRFFVSACGAVACCERRGARGCDKLGLCEDVAGWGGGCRVDL